MKYLVVTILLTASFYSVHAQENRSGILEDLERDKTTNQQTQSAFTATIKSATRLFEDKNDLTSVITVIPSGSEVDVLGADSTYLRVVYDEIEGFILKRHAIIKQIPMSDRRDVAASDPSGQAPSRSQPQSQTQPQQQSQPQQQQQQESRFTYLENKYGSSMASRLIAGKIWKGMSGEMVRDSWGKPLKINRVISGNTVKEEWIYKTTWLYIEDDLLMTWGPVQRQ